MKWESVAQTLNEWLEQHPQHDFLDETQRNSIDVINERIAGHGLVIADEVGTGKTRIASAVACCVLRHAGTVAIVVPRGLMHQWKSELREVARRVQFSELDIISVESFWSLAELTGLQSKRNGSRLLLLPHSFRFPSIRMQSPPRRFHLAALIGGAILERDGRYYSEERKHFGQYFRRNQNEYEADTKLALAIVLKVFALKEDERRALIERLFCLSFGFKDRVLCPKADEYMEKKEGRRLTETLIGLCLGKVDLLIIDEAHKSREFALPDADSKRVEADYQKVLGRLLNNVLRCGPDARVLSLTATPVEMGPGEWQNILGRTQITQLTQSPERLKSINSFKLALDGAGRFPDDPVAIENLLTASRRFEGTLRPYVLRRRTANQPFMKRFLSACPELAVGAHGHRNITLTKISFAALSPSWKRILVACEGLARASQGLNLPSTEKQLHLRIASGNLSPDALLDQVIKPESIAGVGPNAESNLTPVTAGPQPTNAQQARATFWRECLKREVGSRNLEGELYRHPRLRITAERIEHWLEKKEKVLVFGFLVAPLRRLRDLVNIRYALRCLDRKQPVAKAMLSVRHAGTRNLGQRLITQEFSDLIEDGRVYPGALKACMAQQGLDNRRLLALLETASRRYDAERDALSRKVTEKTLADVEPSLFLKGMPAKDREKLLRFFRSSIVERTIYGEDLNSQAPRGLTNTKDQLREIADELMEIVHPDDTGTENDDYLEDSSEGGARTMENYRRLMEVIQESTTVGTFCRQMDGSTPWQTRRFIQSGFNRPSGFPRALIAQSMVGREGLNLHKQCRVVIQFHPEWNPGVTEQQIGRVDRHESRWAVLANEWLESGAKSGEPPPRIEVEQIIFEGTYDEHQWRTLFDRKGHLDASLFSELLPAEALKKVPERFRERLRDEAPDFTPKPKRKRRNY